jgi:nitroimidazol reductase NimA-like FMN-containing flavoprotein (pyridoxamine 5'-phosphate oxidase superfamily)
MIDKLNEQQIEDLLQKEVVGRIACHDNDFIYLVPISYAYDGMFIYAHSLEGTKLNIMRKNSNVCFEVDNITDMSNWKSVIAWGKFEELTDKEERDKALKALINRHLPLKSSATTHLGNTWPFSENDTEEIKGIVFRIAISKKTGRFEYTSSLKSGIDR